MSLCVFVRCKGLDAPITVSGFGTDFIVCAHARMGDIVCLHYNTARVEVIFPELCISMDVMRSTEQYASSYMLHAAMFSFRVMPPLRSLFFGLALPLRIGLLPRLLRAFSASFETRAQTLDAYVLKLIKREAELFPKILAQINRSAASTPLIPALLGVVASYLPLSDYEQTRKHARLSRHHQELRYVKRARTPPRDRCVWAYELLLQRQARGNANPGNTAKYGKKPLQREKKPRNSSTTKNIKRTD